MKRQNWKQMMRTVFWSVVASAIVFMAPVTAMADEGGRPLGGIEFVPDYTPVEADAISSEEAEELLMEDCPEPFVFSESPEAYGETASPMMGMNPAQRMVCLCKA